MVFFICDECGETVKKKQVLQHNYRCRNARYSCMDCQAVFDKKSYQTHTKCITENQKYGGANHVPKVNKGEQKQDTWVAQVRAAIRQVNEPRLKNLLRSIQSHTNIPRKEAKFINFLQNSLRVRERALCVDAWEAIKRETAKEGKGAGATTTVEDGGIEVVGEVQPEITVLAEMDATDDDDDPTTITINDDENTTTEHEDNSDKEKDNNRGWENAEKQPPRPPAPVPLQKGRHIKFDE